MRTLLLSLSLAALSLLSSGCRSRGDDVDDSMMGAMSYASGEALYTRTGMHFDVKDGRYMMYSSNYIGVNKYLPPGTRLNYQGISRNRLSFTDDNGSEFLIEFVPKHSKMTLPDWMAQQFSAQPEALPEGLTDEDRAGIEEGVAKVGMSRQAVILAIGHPPKSLAPSEQDTVLKYERKRMFPFNVRFGADDRVVEVSR